ncbi:MAG: hypothetical protein BWY74_02660 [Firmicutes bacterium ADurb.Bin419]|nr:MAG: hypothetical protein BWY74_02660 [Firmicutes bacterium ADurb.Bin419]
MLYENTSTITTAGSKYTLTGETEPGCALKINDEIFTINDDGTFIHDLKLSGGDNIFTIVASDIAGNSTMQKINIRKANSLHTGNDSFTIGNLLPLIIAFALSIIIVICVLVFSRTYAKKVPEGRFKAVLSVIRNAFAITTLLAFAVSIFAFFMKRGAADILNSAEYYDLVQESVLKAHEAINTYESINRFFIIACIVFVTCLLITVLLSWVLKSYKSSNKESATKDI